MITTNSRYISERLFRLRSHGITRDNAHMECESHGPWYYQQVDLGYNYRMTDMQAALGISQLDNLDIFVARRHELAKRYNEELFDLPLILPWQHSDTYSAFHLYVVKLISDYCGLTRRQLFDSLRYENIGVNVHYIPVHLQPYYKRMGFTQSMFPEAERYYTDAFSLPIFPAMTEEQQNKVINILTKQLTKSRNIK